MRAEQASRAPCGEHPEAEQAVRRAGALAEGRGEEPEEHRQPEQAVLGGDVEVLVVRIVRDQSVDPGCGRRRVCDRLRVNAPVP